MIQAINAAGQVSLTQYDLHDQATNTVDANGVSMDMTYDALGRLLTRAPSSGYGTGVERFGYSARGLIAYTNQLDKVTRYGYDEAGRKLAETNANLEATQFSYSPGSDLLTQPAIPTRGELGHRVWPCHSRLRVKCRRGISSAATFCSSCHQRAVRRRAIA